MYPVYIDAYSTAAHANWPRSMQPMPMTISWIHQRLAPMYRSAQQIYQIQRHRWPQTHRHRYQKPAIMLIHIQRRLQHRSHQSHHIQWLLHHHASHWGDLALTCSLTYIHICDSTQLEYLFSILEFRLCLARCWQRRVSVLDVLFAFEKFYSDFIVIL